MRTTVAKQKRLYPHRETNPESLHSTRTPTLDCSSPISSLQRTAGNHAVGQFLQAKLAVSAPGDQYEQEADRVAEQVTQRSGQSLSNPLKEAFVSPFVQRKVSGSAAGISQAPPSVHAALSSPGQPLSPPLLEEMGQRFGHDFSHVRVHIDSAAEQSAQDVSAQAYTVGQDIVFAPGRFAEDVQEGHRLIAHELAHVIQQERGGASAPPLQGGVLERHADAAASAVVSGSRSINVSGASAPGLARQPLEKEKKRRLRDMLNLDPAKPQDRQLGYELDLIENLLTVTGAPLSDRAIVEKALELHNNTKGKVGGAVLAYYDRVVAGAVSGMLAQAATPVVTKTDPSGKVEVLLRAGELALAHKKLQIDTALNLIEGFAKAGAVAIAGSLAGGLLMLAAAAAPAVFGAYAGVSTMSAEAATALALRLAPRLMLWAASNPYLAEAVAVTVVSTVLEVAETGTVDPMGVVFNLLHLRYTQLQTRTPAPVPSRPTSGQPPPESPPTPGPTLIVKQGGGQGSGKATGMLRTTDAASPGVEVDVSHPVFKGKTPTNDVLPPPQNQAVRVAVNAPITDTRTGEIAPIKVNEGVGAKPDPSNIRMASSSGSGRRPPTSGSVRSSATTAAPPARGAHPRVIPRDELPARRAAQDIDQTQVDIEPPVGDSRGSVTPSGGGSSQVPNVAQGEISKTEFSRPVAEKPAPPPIRQSPVPAQRLPLAGKVDHEKLPRPQAYQGKGAQAFGEAIEWGAGEQGANNLTKTIKNNPRGAQQYLTRLRDRGITSDMARAWAEFYEKEAVRMGTNTTAKARAALMSLIAERL